MNAFGGAFRLLAMVCIVILVGCTVGQEVSRGTLDRAALGALDAWESRGRVALNSGGRGVQANFTWRQDGPATRLELSGPWGMGTERLLIDRDDVLLWSDGDWIPMCGSSTVAAELELLCGSAPLNSLPFWLRGLPDPVHPHEEMGSRSNGGSGFLQQGWRIEVDALTQARDLMVPRRVFISGADASLKVAITGWDLPPTP
ncbi:lipoprotein insertase outer membrane protein LolB [Candidatus Foliamicus sp.]